MEDADAIPDLATGDVVTFTYEYFSQRSLPTAPKIQRKRKDLSWEDVLREEKKEDPNVSFAHGMYECECASRGGDRIR